MKQSEFMARLARESEDMPKAERERTLEYYAEAFSDRLDEGMEEEKIIESFGNPKEIVRSLESEMGRGKRLRGKAWLIVPTSPIWIALSGAIIGIAAAIIAVYIALWAATIGAIGSGISVMVLGIVEHTAAGWCVSGEGMAACGIGILMAYYVIPCANRVMAWLWRGARKITRRIGREL